MTLVLRAEPAPPSATLLIHMGAGALDSVVGAALRNYGEYRALGRDGLGIFAVSVFAVIEGVTEAAILDALPQSSFARATVGAVCERSGEAVFGARRNPRLMLGGPVGGVRLTVGVGGGDFEAVVLAQSP
jgi:hypothetical protein